MIIFWKWINYPCLEFHFFKGDKDCPNFIKDEIDKYWDYVRFCYSVCQKRNAKASVPVFPWLSCGRATGAL
jgi:hypothetical protein